MSEQRSYHITCPRCRKEMDVTLYESINIKTDPALREQLMMNQINAVTCPSCRFAFRVDKPLLYSDPDRRLLIYCIPVAEDAYEQGQEAFSELLRDMGSVLPDGIRAPNVHLVFNRTELIERIFLIEAGLNERVIEYVKYVMYSKNAGRLAPEAKILLFDAQDSTDEFLCFVVQDVASRKLEGILQYQREAYRAFSEMFSEGEKSADLMEMFPGPYISARNILRRELSEERSRPQKPRN